MKKLDQKSEEPLAHFISESKYEFAVGEIYFLKASQIRRKMKELEQEVCWMQRDKERTYSKKERRKLDGNIKSYYSLHARMRESIEERTQNKQYFNNERYAAYSHLQILNFTQYILNRVIECLKEREVDPSLVFDLALRFLDSKEALKDAEFQIKYMQNHLMTQMNFNPKGLCESAKEVLELE
jgi:hypothetical protein